MSTERFTDVRACLFDAYGTLFDVHAPVSRETAALGDKGEAVSALWRQKQLQYTWLRSLMGAHADFWEITGDALDYALNSHGIDDPNLRQRLMDLYRALDIYPEAPDTLRRLRAAGLKTGILSNGEPGMLGDAVGSAGIADLLDDVISVEEVGVYKPDPRTYQRGVDRAGVPAGAVCFVSANAWDVAGAARFGFQVAWINRFGQKAERLPGRPKAEVKTLDQVAALLGV